MVRLSLAITNILAVLRRLCFAKILTFELAYGHAFGSYAECVSCPNSLCQGSAEYSLSRLYSEVLLSFFRSKTVGREGQSSRRALDFALFGAPLVQYELVLFSSVRNSLRRNHQPKETAVNI